MANFIKLIIVDDHPMVLDGMVNYLKTSRDIEILATSTHLSDVMRLVALLKPDILLMDYHFTNEQQHTGLDVCRKVTEGYPGVKVIIVSSFGDVALIKEFIDAGASGYLLKTATQPEFIEAISNVFAGGQWFSRDVREILVNERLQNTNKQIIKFTRTEKEILTMIIEGASTSDIAKKICREKSTIDSHRKSILAKLQAMDTNGNKPSKNIMYYISKLNIARRIDNL
jgi:DNA-binding NarL/FixJ family response regulator